MKHVATLTIPSGGTESNEFVHPGLRYAEVIGIFPPATLDAVVFSLDVTPEPEAPAAADWFKHQSAPATPLAFTAAEPVAIDPVYFVGMRIAAASAVAADRIFRVVFDEKLH